VRRDNWLLTRRDGRGGHAKRSLKEEEVFQQEKVEGQRRKGWTNIAGAALSFGVSVGGEGRGAGGQGRYYF
jgi:hypothetical protein